MRPKRLMLAGVTRVNRHAAMADINDAVLRANGWVAGHTLFSNIATTFQIALPPARYVPFCSELEAMGIALDDESRTAVAALDADSRTADAVIQASLNITFIHNEPDLRRDIPSVPG
jgi:hypothetical protein